MGYPQARSNPALTNDSVATHTVGKIYVYEGEEYRYCRFMDSVAYAAKQALTWSDRASGQVTNDVSESESSAILAGFAMAAVTSGNYGFVKKSGSLSNVPKLGGVDGITPHTALFPAAGTDGVLETRAASAANASSVFCWAADTSEDSGDNEDTVDVYFDCP